MLFDVLTFSAYRDYLYLYRSTCSDGKTCDLYMYDYIFTKTNYVAVEKKSNVLKNGESLEIEDSIRRLHVMVFLIGLYVRMKSRCCSTPEVHWWFRWNENFRCQFKYFICFKEVE